MSAPSQISPQLLERINDAIDSWNRGDVAQLLSHYAEDVALSSPMSGPPGQGSSWLQGREEVAGHKINMRSVIPNVKLVDILKGSGFVTLLLDSGTRYFTMTFEPDDDCRARRVIICHGQDRAEHPHAS